MERSDSTIRHSSFDILHSRGSPDPYEHSHVGPQLDDDDSGMNSGLAVSVCGSLGGFFSARFRRDDTKLNTGLIDSNTTTSAPAHCNQSGTTSEACPTMA